MPSEKRSFQASIGMIFIVLGVSVVVPGVIVNLESPQSSTFTQGVNERTVITGDVSSQVTLISNQGEVNISMVDRKSGEFESTGELQPGESAILSFEGEDVNVTVVDVFGTSEAVVTYVYPLYIGWPDGADLVVRESPLLIMLSAVVMLTGLLFTVTGVLDG